jgi:hypothetical protein
VSVGAALRGVGRALGLDGRLTGGIDCHGLDSRFQDTDLAFSIPAVQSQKQIIRVLGIESQIVAEQSTLELIQLQLGRHVIVEIIQQQVCVLATNLEHGVVQIRLRERLGGDWPNRLSLADAKRPVFPGSSSVKIWRPSFSARDISFLEI